MDRLEKGRAAEARYSGRCALCGHGFEAGEKIWKSRLGWAHEGCPPEDERAWLEAYWEDEIASSPVTKYVIREGLGVDGMLERFSISRSVEPLMGMWRYVLPRPHKSVSIGFRMRCRIHARPPSLEAILGALDSIAGGKEEYYAKFEEMKKKEQDLLQMSREVLRQVGEAHLRRETTLVHERGG